MSRKNISENAGGLKRIAADVVISQELKGLADEFSAWKKRLQKMRKAFKEIPEIKEGRAHFNLSRIIECIASATPEGVLHKDYSDGQWESYPPTKVSMWPPVAQCDTGSGDMPVMPVAFPLGEVLGLFDAKLMEEVKKISSQAGKKAAAELPIVQQEFLDAVLALDDFRKEWLSDQNKYEKLYDGLSAYRKEMNARAEQKEAAAREAAEQDQGRNALRLLCERRAAMQGGEDQGRG